MALRSLSTSALRAELARREKGAKKYIARHAKMSKMLAALEVQLADLGLGAMSVHRGTGKRRGRPPGSKNKRRGRPAGSKNKNRGRKPGRRGRGKNALSLHEALAKAVRVGSTVSPADAAAAVKRAGYKSGSKTFGVQVAIALAKSPLFKRTGRGQYVRRPGDVGPPAKRGPKPKMGRKVRRGRKARRSAKRGRKPGRPKGSKNKKPGAASAAPAAS